MGAQAWCRKRRNGQQKAELCCSPAHLSWPVRCLQRLLMLVASCRLLLLAAALCSRFGLRHPTRRGPAPLDEDEIREAVEQLLLRRAPAAVVRLVGKSAYARYSCWRGWLQSRPAGTCLCGWMLCVHDGRLVNSASLLHRAVDGICWHVSTHHCQQPLALAVACATSSACCSHRPSAVSWATAAWRSPLCTSSRSSSRSSARCSTEGWSEPACLQCLLRPWSLPLQVSTWLGGGLPAHHSASCRSWLGSMATNLSLSRALEALTSCTRY